MSNGLVPVRSKVPQVVNRPVSLSVNSDLKIQKMISHDNERNAWMRLLRDIISNPAFELVAGFSIIEYLAHVPMGSTTTRNNWFWGLWGVETTRDLYLMERPQATLAELSLLMAVFCQQLGSENTFKLLELGAEQAGSLIKSAIDATGNLTKAGLSAALAAV